MRKEALVLLMIAVTATGIFAKSTDDEAVITALKFFLSKQDDGVYMVRAFQYTVTTEKNNPGCYLVGNLPAAASALAEAGLTKKDKSRYVATFADRDGARVQRLWCAFGNELLALLPKAKYDELLKWSVDEAITYRESARYAGDLAKLMRECPWPDKDVLDKTYGICGSNYSQLAFWYRRTMEKNDEITCRILKEIQQYYK
jgi:hypothetical protein